MDPAVTKTPHTDAEAKVRIEIDVSYWRNSLGLPAGGHELHLIPGRKGERNTLQ